MGSIVIRFDFDRKTGKKKMVIEYESDSDMTELEHEKKHRRLVESLVGKDRAAEAAEERRKGDHTEAADRRPEAAPAASRKAEGETT